MHTKERHTFPEFEKHTDAYCFNCGSDIGEHWGISGYGRGNGEYLSSCPKCDYTTYYDLSNHPRESN